MYLFYFDLNLVLIFLVVDIKTSKKIKNGEFPVVKGVAKHTIGKPVTEDLVTLQLRGSLNSKAPCAVDKRGRLNPKTYSQRKPRKVPVVDKTFKTP